MSSLFAESTPVIPRLRTLPSGRRQREWEAGVAVDAYGLAVGLRVTDRALWPQVKALLPLGCVPRPDPRVDYLYSVVTETEKMHPEHILYENDTELRRTIHLDRVLAYLSALLHELVATRQHDFLFVHAGAVGWRGAGIVIPGRTHSGKSTLVHALVRRGATYYSDEYALLGPDGQLYPYLRELQPRYPGSEQRRRVTVVSEGKAEPAPVPVRYIALLEYHPRAGWAVEGRTAGEAAMSLLGHAFAAQNFAEVVLDRLLPVCGGARVVSGTRGAAQDAAARLLSLADGEGIHWQ